jgi:hypothetical protein
MVPLAYTVDFERGTVKLPKIGVVKVKYHRTFAGAMKTPRSISNNSHLQARNSAARACGLAPEGEEDDSREAPPNRCGVVHL